MEVRKEIAMPDCLFCKIVNGTIPAAKLFEDENLVAFADIHPQAPTHFLVIPRKHLASLDAASSANSDDTLLLGQLLAFASMAAAKSGLGEGYRVVINTGELGGQTVDHLHLHVLGGRQMHWPPG